MPQSFVMNIYRVCEGLKSVFSRFECLQNKANGSICSAHEPPEHREAPTREIYYRTVEDVNALYNAWLLRRKRFKGSFAIAGRCQCLLMHLLQAQPVQFAGLPTATQPGLRRKAQALHSAEVADENLPSPPHGDIRLWSLRWRGPDQFRGNSRADKSGFIPRRIIQGEEAFILRAFLGQAFSIPSQDVSTSDRPSLSRWLFLLKSPAPVGDTKGITSRSNAGDTGGGKCRRGFQLEDSSGKDW